MPITFPPVTSPTPQGFTPTTPAPASSQASGHPFNDTHNYWAEDSIETLAQQGLVKGFGDGTFRPNQNITRAEFAALLYSAYGHLPPRRDTLTFSDVPPGHWAHKAIAWAARVGFFAGYPNGTFQPNQPISRAQALVALSTGLKYRAPQDPNTLLQRRVHDAGAIPAYAKAALAAAVDASLVVNHPDRQHLRPNDVLTRGEAAAELCRFKHLPGAPADAVLWNPSYAIAPRFEYGSDFVDGLAVVKENGRFGVIDKNGNSVIPSEYDVVYPFSQGLAAVRRGNKMGFVDRDNRVVVLLKYDDVCSFNDGRARVQRDGLVGFIDNQGNEVIPPQYAAAHWGFSEGVACVYTGNAWRLIDTAGQPFVPQAFYYAQPFHEGVAWVMLDRDTPAILDKNGTVTRLALGQNEKIITTEPPAPFFEGLSRVEVVRDGKNVGYGFVDKSGALAIPPSFINAESFSDGVAMVRTRDERWCFIDHNGTVVLAGGPTGYTSFHEGFAGMLDKDAGGIQGGGLWGLIDKQGRQVYAPMFEFEPRVSEGMMAVKDGLYGYVRVPPAP
jgi:hypothetical protein